MENKKTTAVANSTPYTLSSKLNINQWAEEDRPREKMERLGAEALSDAELLAILVGSGSPQEDAVSLMKRILADCNNNLNTLGKLTIRDFCHDFFSTGFPKFIIPVATIYFAVVFLPIRITMREPIQILAIIRIKNYNLSVLIKGFIGYS